MPPNTALERTTATLLRSTVAAIGRAPCARRPRQRLWLSLGPLGDIDHHGIYKNGFLRCLFTDMKHIIPLSAVCLVASAHAATLPIQDEVGRRIDRVVNGL